MTNIELGTSFRYRKTADRSCGFQFKQSRQLRDVEHQQQHLQHLRKQLGLGVRTQDELESYRSLGDLEHDELVSKILGPHVNKMKAKSEADHHRERSHRFTFHNLGRLNPAARAASKPKILKKNSISGTRNQYASLDLSQLSLVPLCSCAETKMYRLGVKSTKHQQNCTFEKNSMSNYFHCQFCSPDDSESSSTVTDMSLSVKKLAKPQLCMRIEPWKEYIIQSSVVGSGKLETFDINGTISAKSRPTSREISSAELCGQTMTSHPRYKPTDVLADLQENSSTNSTSEKNGDQEKSETNWSPKRTITVVIPNSHDDCSSRASDPVSRCPTRFMDPLDEEKVTTKHGGPQTPLSDYDLQSVYRTSYTHFDRMVPRGPTQAVNYSLLTPVNNPW